VPFLEIMSSNRAPEPKFLSFSHFWGHWLTTFISDQIRSFQFSPHGKTLGVVRVHVVSDVVLPRDSSTSSR
jgi:hypothetical protein